MLVRENLLRYIRFHLREQQFLGNYPVKFSQTKNFHLATKFRLRWEYFKAALFAVYVFVLCVQFLLEQNVPLVKSLKSAMFVGAFFVYCLVKWIVLLRRKSLVELYNLLLKFEDQNCKGKYY